MKLINFTLLLLPLFLFSCKSDQAGQETADLERAVSASADTKAVQKLLGTYQASLQDTNVDAAAKAEIVGKLAKLQADNQQIPAAIQTLKNGISSYYAAPATAANVWILGEIIKNQSPVVAKIIQKLYADRYPKGVQVAAAKQLLGNDTTSLYQDLDNLGSAMYNEKTHRLETRIAGDFIESCDIFATLKPEDPKSADYLHKAGETARATRNFTRAIGIYDRIHVNYPNFAKAPQALFLKAFTYDNDLKDYAKAKTLYTEFLEKYPNDDFADDTQFLLKNLGKSDEEIIQNFSKDKAQ